MRPFYPIFTQYRARTPHYPITALYLWDRFPQTARWALTDGSLQIQIKRYSPFPARFPFVTFMSRGRDEADGEPVDDLGLVPAVLVPLIGLSADSPFSYSS